MRPPHRLAVALLVHLTVVSAAHAAPSSEPPLAELRGPNGPLQITREGRFGVPSSDPLATLKVDDQQPERGWLRVVTLGGEKLVEAGVWRGKHGRVLLVRTSPNGGTILLDEPVGKNADGDLEYHVQFAADGPRRWQSTLGTRRCDAVQPLFLERYDLSAKTWTPLALPVPAAPNLAAVSARPLPPPRRALRFSFGSTDGSSTRADYLGAPRALDDQNLETTLPLGQGPRARGAFFTAQGQRSIELTAVRVDPVAAPARLPTALVIIAGSPAKAVHRLPLGPKGGLYVLPRPITTACVTFVVDDDGRAPEPALSEIVLHAADDSANALPGLVKTVAQQTEGAEDAARALEEAGPVVAAMVLDTLPEATPAGRSRLFAVLFELRKNLPPEVGPRLGKLLETAHGGERAVLLEMLIGNPSSARVEALRLYADRSQASEARVDAITILGRKAVAADPAAATALIAALADADPAVVRAARKAAAYAESPAVLDEALRVLTASGRAVSADLISVFAAGPPLAPEAQQRVLAALAALGPVETLPFPLGVRVLDVLAKLDPSSSAHAVGQVLAAGKDPTLRLVAVDSLGKLEPGTLRMLLDRAAADADARVREHALHRLLSFTDAASGKIFDRAAEDAWPEVRKVAYTGLGATCAFDPGFALHLDARIFDRKKADPDPLSRSEALAALMRCPGSTADKLIAATGDKQPAEVRERAAGLLGDRGPSVLPAIVKALDRTFERGGSEMPLVAVALLRAIGRLGPKATYDDATLVMLRDAAADPFFPGIRMAALEALARGCPEGAKVVFDRADKDPEPAVQRASALGRTMCNR